MDKFAVVLVTNVYFYFLEVKGTPGNSGVLSFIFLTFIHLNFNMV